MLGTVDLANQSAKTLRQPACQRLFSAIAPALHQLREQTGAERIDLGDIVEIERYAGAVEDVVIALMSGSSVAA